MKKLRSIAAFVLVLMLMCSLTVSVFAAGDGKITVINATEGAQYVLYRVFDATVGENGAISYTYAGTLAENDYFEQDEFGYVTAKPAAFAQDSTERLSDGAIAWIKANGTQIDSITAAGKTVEFDNLDYGYYYVTSQLGSAITVTSTNPTATVIDKNQVPSWKDDGKTLVSDHLVSPSVNSASYGDTVCFKVEINYTNYAGEERITNYMIKDTIEGMDYNKDIVIKVNDTPITNYTVTYGEDGQSFYVNMPWRDDDSFLYSNTGVIEMTYSAVVNETATIAGNGNKNTATYDYRTEKDPPDRDPYHESEPRITTTYTYALAINKIDEYGNPLGGAEFTLVDADGPVTVRQTEQEGIYVYDAASTSNKVISPENGIIIVKGIRAGEYTFTEGKSPDGFNLLKEPITIEAVCSSSVTYTEVITTYYDADGKVVDVQVEGGSSSSVNVVVPVVSVNVVNEKGVPLPTTGGIGTRIFYILGALLVFGTVLVFVVKRRVRPEE